MLFLRDVGSTEVGGFGLTNPQDLLFVEDFVMVQQVCSAVTVAFDDDSVAEFFDQQIDAGRRPETFGRVWIHSHPGTSAEPSNVDEETFARVFGRSDWAVMAILARGGQTYARLQYHVGPGGSLQIPVAVDWSQPFEATDWTAWQQEYVDNVRRDGPLRGGTFDKIRTSHAVTEFLTDHEWLLQTEKGMS
ncbi:MAG: hypothetical protein JWM11_971 [Planctomycetaceae bacterium]|nr:hypothetical protein [Planctomycetaceae bacterium]